MSENMFKILKALFTDDHFEKAIFESKFQEVLPVYNKLRNSSIQNNFYFMQMFKIFVEIGNFNSIVILVAEYLDYIESKGMKKMRKLPYWAENCIFYIIE
jgi:hypothetical protein